MDQIQHPGEKKKIQIESKVITCMKEESTGGIVNAIIFHYKEVL